MRLGVCMSGNEQVMAVMLEEDDLRMVHRDWPRKMRLAVCLMPSGECQLLLFRQEEAGIFAARLRKHLGLRAAEVCIYPPVHGFPSRQLRYSDERSLAALLADSPQLVEEANDYSVNFAFALEEGLDPVEFLGGDAPEPDVEPALLSEGTVSDDASLHFSSRRAPEEVVAPKSAERRLHLSFAAAEPRAAAVQEATASFAAPAQSTPVAPPAMPGAAFKAVSELQDETIPPSYRLREDAENFVISNGAGPVVEIAYGGQLFLRDDRALLAIHLQDEGSRPGTVRIKTDILPKSLKSALRAACGTVEVSREGAFLYVELPVEGAKDAPVVAAPEVAATEPEAPEVPAARAVQKVSKRRAAYRLLALTTLTVLAIVVIMGVQPLGVFDQNAENGPIDWSQFRLSMQSGS